MCGESAASHKGAPGVHRTVRPTGPPSPRLDAASRCPVRRARRAGLALDALHEPPPSPTWPIGSGTRGACRRRQAVAHARPSLPERCPAARHAATPRPRQRAAPEPGGQQASIVRKLAALEQSTNLMWRTHLSGKDCAVGGAAGGHAHKEGVLRIVRCRDRFIPSRSLGGPHGRQRRFGWVLALIGALVCTTGRRRPTSYVLDPPRAAAHPTMVVVAAALPPPSPSLPPPEPPRHVRAIRVPLSLGACVSARPPAGGGGGGGGRVSPRDKAITARTTTRDTAVCLCCWVDAVTGGASKPDDLWYYSIKYDEWRGEEHKVARGSSRTNNVSNAGEHCDAVAGREYARHR